jgi:alpha-mannosidase
MRRVNKTGDSSGLYIGYKYFGVGDMGGAPDDSSVWWLTKSIKSTGPLKVISAPADLLCSQITPEQLDKLPVYNGDFVAKDHGIGCYTSQAAMKRWNRKNELLADATERASVVANWLGGATYPQERINNAWQHFIWHQFHDDLTGTSIPEAYTFSWNDELISQNQFASVLENAGGAVSRGLETNVKGTAITVYNPLSINRDDIVEATLVFDKTPKYIKVIDKDGKETPSQIIDIQGKNTKILFIAQTPSVGFAVYDVQLSDSPSGIKNNLKISNESIENEKYMVKIDANGDASNIYDKEIKQELLESPIRFALFSNVLHSFPSWEIPYENITAAPRGYVDGKAVFEIVENGPVRVSLKITREKEGSTYTQYIRLSSGNTKERVDFVNNVNCNTRNTLLKAVFTLKASNLKATYDLGLGTVQRTNNHPKLYEVPAQQWADVTNPDNSFGVSVLNDCKYGWDKPSDNTIRLTLLHIPKHKFEVYYDQNNQDIGNHQFTFSINGHNGDWRTGNTQWEAAKLNQPLIAFQAPKHNGKLGRTFSFFKVNSSQVMVKAIKKAELTDEIIVRLQELSGSEQKNLTFEFAAPIVNAREVNGTEDSIGNAKVENGKLIFNIGGYKPKTYAVKLAKSAIDLDKANSMPIKLSYDIDAYSYDDNRSDGNFDNKGVTYPAELIPDNIDFNGIVFKTGSKDNRQNNVVSCKGNKIDISGKNKYNKIYILAASINGDKKATFTINGIKTELNICDYAQMIGQWDSRVPGKAYRDTLLFNGQSINIFKLTPAYYKDARIAWIGTHKHKNKPDSNMAYEFCYMFCLSIDLPADAKYLELPNDDDIKIFAISMGNNPNENTIPLQPIVDVPVKWDNVKIESLNGEYGFTDTTTIKLYSGNATDTILFTTDGTVPNNLSQRYVSSFKISNSTGINAILFSALTKHKYISEATFIKIPYLNSVEVPDLENGLNCKVYEGVWEWLIPDFTKLTPVASFNSNKIETPEAYLNKINFGLQFKGYIKLNDDGLYRFCISSEDGSNVTIDDIKITDNDGLHRLIEVQGSVFLKKGYHKFEVSYIRREWGKGLFLEYEGPNISRQIVTEDILFRKKDK